MSDYTPTTNAIREIYAGERHPYVRTVPAYEEFDRWLAGVEREAAARALEEAAESYAYVHAVSRASRVYSWLRARAAEIREGKRP